MVISMAWRSGELETGRLEAFSDGIFAFAMLSTV